MGSHIVFGKETGEKFVFYSGCDVTDMDRAPARSDDLSSMQVACHGEDAGQSLNLGLACDTSTYECKVENRFDISAKADGAFYLILDLPKNHKFNDLTQLPGFAMQSDVIIADVKYKEGLKGIDIAGEVRFFRSDSRYLRGGKSAASKFESWLKLRESSMASKTFLGVQSIDPVQLDPIKIPNKVMLDKIVGSPETFIIIDGRGTIFAESAEAAQKALGEARGPVATFIHLQNAGGATKRPLLFKNTKPAELAAYVRGTIVSKMPSMKTLVQGTEPAGGSFLSSGWNLRAGVIAKSYEWIDKKAYHEAAGRMFDEEYREDLVDTIVDPNVSDDDCIGGIAMCGARFGLFLYPAQDMIGGGFNLDVTTNGLFRTYEPGLQLEADLGNIADQIAIPDGMGEDSDDSPFGIVPFFRLGGIFGEGEYKTGQLISNPTGNSLSGIAYAIGAHARFTFDIGETMRLSLLAGVEWERAMASFAAPRTFGAENVDIGNSEHTAGFLLLAFGEFEREPHLVDILTTGDENNADRVVVAEARKNIDPTRWRASFGSFEAPESIEVTATGLRTEIDPALLGVPTGENIQDGSITNDLDSKNPLPVGNADIKWTAKDKDSGRVMTANQIVTVVDKTPPQIEEPTAILVSTPDGSEVEVPKKQPTAHDLETPSGDLHFRFEPEKTKYPEGEHIRKWIVTDAGGNEATADQKITVIRGGKFDAPADVTIEATGPRTRVTVEQLGVPSFDDMIAENSVVSDLEEVRTGPSGGFVIGEEYKITWTGFEKVTDRLIESEQILKIVDTTPPVITPPETETYISPDGNPVDVPLPAPSAADLVTPAGEIKFEREPKGSSFGVGEHKVKWTAIDAIGNRSAPVEQKIIVERLGEFSAPAPLVIEAESIYTQIRYEMLNKPDVPETFDKDSLNSNFESLLESPSYVNGFGVGEHEVEWGVTDKTGVHTRKVKGKIIIKDTTPPIIKVEDVEEMSPDGNSVKVDMDDFTIDDATVSWLELKGRVKRVPETGTFPVGTHKVKYSVTDLHGNSAEVVRTIVITPPPKPSGYRKLGLPPLVKVDFSDQIEFIQGQINPVEGESGSGRLSSIVEQIRKKIEDAYPKTDYPAGVPADSVLTLTIRGHASPESGAIGNLSLSSGRANLMALNIYEKLVEAKGNGVSPFDRLNIDRSNIFVFGMGETVPISVFGDRVTGFFGGNENDAANLQVKDKEYILCKGDLPAKIDHKNKKCAVEIMVDLAMSRRTDVEVNIYPAGTEVEKPTFAAISEVQKQADQTLAGKIIAFLQGTREYKSIAMAKKQKEKKGIADITGFRGIVYQKETNSLHIVVDKIGYEENFAAIRKWLSESVAEAQKKAKSSLSSACRVKVWLYYEDRAGSDADYIEGLKQKFYRFGQWPFLSGFNAEIVKKKYTKADADAEQRKEIKALKTDFAGVKPEEISDKLKMIAIPVKSAKGLTPEEAAVITAHLKKIAEEGAGTALYIHSAEALDEKAAVAAANIARAVFPNLKTAETTDNSGVAPEYRLEDHVILIFGETTPDLDKERDLVDAVYRMLLVKTGKLKEE